MSLAIAHTRACIGISAPPVTVEVQLTNGLPSFSIVGLPEAAVRESKDRVRGALISSGFDHPARRITVNLAPADLRKEGGSFDLPIALGILAASGQLPAEALAGREFLGELALSGILRPARGALCAALAARRAGRALIVPLENLAEAACVRDTRSLGAANLLEVCHHLGAGRPLQEAVPVTPASVRKPPPDLSEVRGQQQARRALEVAAAGGHNLLLIGPPGCGKTMLSSRLVSLLPPLEEAAALEVAAVGSVSRQGWTPTQWGERPYRAPHHSASGVALVGGGSRPQPGEVTLAHRGVLFLDELPEFERRVLEMLREPLESGSITVSRAAGSECFPGRIPTDRGDEPLPLRLPGDARCRCSAEQVARYRARLSGPFLDRIDMHVELPPVEATLLIGSGAAGETSAEVAGRVAEARRRQASRGETLNCRLGKRELDAVCDLGDEELALLRRAMSGLGLSARSLHRLQRVARTVADLDGSRSVGVNHLAEAIGYRRLDRAGGHPA